MSLIKWLLIYISQLWGSLLGSNRQPEHQLLRCHDFYVLGLTLSLQQSLAIAFNMLIIEMRNLTLREVM